MPPRGLEPAIPAGKRPQTYTLDSAATRIGGFDPRTVYSVASGSTDLHVCTMDYS